MSFELRGEEFFKANKGSIDPQATVAENPIKSLSNDLINGKITQEEFEEKIKEILR
ncbi:MAG: hypothetical protein MUE44_11845 [Oscillatoriaceae cyanobacterium Prado104]|nr:hypothetical protein [Oscillatoriaceae cyanobacterium Prado104]